MWAEYSPERPDRFLQQEALHHSVPSLQEIIALFLQVGRFSLMASQQQVVLALGLKSPLLLVYWPLLLQMVVQDIRHLHQFYFVELLALLEQLF